MTLVALIEDDPGIRSSLERALVARSFQVMSVESGAAGYQLVIDRHPDVVVLDLGLPDYDGVEVLKMLRSVCAVPIIVATARDQDAEIIRTLSAGADDYLVKPFSADHLEARLRAVLRRTQPGVVHAITIGDLAIDPASRSVALAGQALDLSRKEFDLLAYLAMNTDRIVAKRELLSAIWDQPWGGADKTVDVHLSWLRKKLGESASEPRYLQSVRGVGIRLVSPKT